MSFMDGKCELPHKILKSLAIVPRRLSFSLLDLLQCCNSFPSYLTKYVGTSTNIINDPSSLTNIVEARTPLRGTKMTSSNRHVLSKNPYIAKTCYYQKGMSCRLKHNAFIPFLYNAILLEPSTNKGTFTNPILLEPGISLKQQKPDRIHR